MRVLFDTSVVVPALVGSHPRHARSLAWLAAVSRGKAEGVMSWNVPDFLRLGTSARVQIVTPDSATPG